MSGYALQQRINEWRMFAPGSAEQDILVFLREGPSAAVDKAEHDW